MRGGGAKSAEVLRGHWAGVRLGGGVPNLSAAPGLGRERGEKVALQSLLPALSQRKRGQCQCSQECGSPGCRDAVGKAPWVTWEVARSGGWAALGGAQSGGALPGAL